MDTIFLMICFCPLQKENSSITSHATLLFHLQLLIRKFCCYFIQESRLALEKGINQINIANHSLTWEQATVCACNYVFQMAVVQRSKVGSKAKNFYYENNETQSWERIKCLGAQLIISVMVVIKFKMKEACRQLQFQHNYIFHTAMAWECTWNT